MLTLHIGKKRTGQASVQQAFGLGNTEGRQFIPGHGRKMDGALATGQAIPKFSGGGQCGGSDRLNSQLREDVGTDFQESAGIPKLMDFIEDDHRSLAGTKEQFRIANHILDDWQVAIDV
ncbi:MAG: hypothetical protein NTX27_08850 [Verrucomicrobia bacterium]|nr:hypothetical protein [Verrucomicrobiota bacterium]